MSISKKDLASERRTRHCRKPKRCVYYAAGSILSYNGTCDYILVTGQRRPCGFGDACTVKRHKAGRCAAAGRERWSKNEQSKRKQAAPSHRVDRGIWLQGADVSGLRGYNGFRGSVSVLRAEILAR